MLKLKLTRTGKKNYPTYKLIVAEAKSKRDGKFIENLGTYNPNTEPQELKLNQNRIRYWLNHGAKPTETVNRLLKKHA
mgnify:CR=1 FL=1